MPDNRIDNTERKQHYGAGRQPWDDIVEAGWGPHFAAGNVLKYLRRDKQREHSLESARWYRDRLWAMAHALVPEWKVAMDTLEALYDKLTPEERALLGAPPK